MNRSTAAITLLLVAFALPAFAAAPSEGSAPADAAPAPATLEAGAPADFQYGPILVDDVDSRIRIKQLYREQYELELSIQDQLASLEEAASSEVDPELRLQLARDGQALKEAHRIQVTELGLEIARLNEDAQRVSEYEQALDQMRNPERYLPPTKDPAVAAAERARDAGLE